MNYKHFVLGLSALSVVIIGLLYWLLRDQTMVYFGGLVMTSFFILFSLLVFYLMDRSRDSKDMYQFSRLFMISVFVKMVFYLFIVVYMVRKMNVPSESLIVPSLLIYLGFTIYETYFLMKLSKKK
ncbi:MAG TPA: hypothetical protein PK006_09810 [Saprospiraceae bacterium]|nr:hypothetical protein [Saprospiraceae bacterium]